MHHPLCGIIILTLFRKCSNSTFLTHIIIVLIFFKLTFYNMAFKNARVLLLCYKIFYQPWRINTNFVQIIMHSLFNYFIFTWYCYIQVKTPKNKTRKNLPNILIMPPRARKSYSLEFKCRVVSWYLDNIEAHNNHDVRATR